MRAAMIGLGVVLLAGGVVVYVMQTGSGAGVPPVGTGAAGAERADDIVASTVPSEDQRALAELRAELSKAEPVSFRSDEQRLIDARAWVTENRPADRPYNEIEAQILALMDVMFDGKKRSAEWTMNMSQIEVEMIRSLDADGDGQVSDEEVQMFIDENVAGMFNPMEHPYLKDQFDTDGDGELTGEEMAGIASMMSDGALAGVFERGTLDAWDSDGDGFVNDEERVAGDRAAMESAREMFGEVLGEGANVLFGDPALSEEEQAAARAALIEQIGEDQIAMIDAQRDMMISQSASQEFMEAMRLDNLPSPDTAELLKTMPTAPDAMAFDIDGDGALAEDEAAAQMEAMQEYQQEVQQWGAELTAYRLLSQFENATAQSDTDADGRMNPSEWEERIDDLLYEREERLFLRSYDLDGSGRIEAGELTTYVEWYRDGSLRADVNYDGNIDALDLEQMAR
jgi:Ca2+-binding EF-hand superfamily protein